jgi:DNA mismatch repair protein MutS
MAKPVETPLMKQYTEMKKKHPDALLLFRVGDFYETFCQDAIDSSSILGITLTRRANGSAQFVELAGFPHHALDTYLPKLVRAGRRVAICEQLEDPKLTKKLVKRGITELITPGVNLNDNILSSAENNFLGGVHFGKNGVGVAFLDISTGEFLCAQGDIEYADKLLNGISPKEVLRMQGTRRNYEEHFTHKSAVFELDDWVYTLSAANERLLKQFGTNSLKGFGVEGMENAVIAAGSLLYYLDQTQHSDTNNITALSRIEEDKYVRLDRFTVRNLELTQPMNSEGMSLVDVLDKTSTPMGARMLRRWILFPLLDIKEINTRLDVVEYFFRDPQMKDSLNEILSGIGDMERLISKVSFRRAGPRELVQLKDSLRGSAKAKNIFSQANSEVLKSLAGRMDFCTEIADKIEATVREDAPALLSKGNVIAEGVNAELDDLRRVVTHGKDALREILDREIEATGITSLKISFNNVFGYYIEVRNTHRDKVPETWIRKQTLVSAERYITPELKEYEQKILGAEDRIASLESSIFQSLIEEVALQSSAVLTNAGILARADVMLSFAKAAEAYKYVRPVIDDSYTLSITEGRHPVIERRLPPGEPYISNSLELDSDHHQIMMITGPNMSGKSALLRQTALITLMAQIGCFVPAEAARIGIVDKIFTRVGASDNISLGESTFMVEMNESAAILNNMSPRSLILFDELGRGTSTYDGISIAWSIVEHIHENGYARPKTLFATHYHELNEMEKSFPRIVNYNVAVEEMNGRVIFLRKLRQGGSEHSFGIHVAKLAGMPPSIVKRAEQVLAQLEEASKESNTNSKNNKSSVSKSGMANIGTHREGYQLSFFQLDDPLLSQIRDKILALDIDNLTPLQSLTLLHDLRGLITGKME